MVLGNGCSSMKMRSAADREQGMGFEFVRCTRSFGRKRVVISNLDSTFLDDDSSPKTPLKRLCGGGFVNADAEKSALESLPQDILIRILCGVDHDDLEQLFHVSKAIREATLIAKEWHFAYSTPRETRAFRNPFDLGNPPDFDEIEAPNAPKQLRSYKTRLSGKDFSDASTLLFDDSPRKGLFFEM